jgi:nitrate reductase delta subunit
MTAAVDVWDRLAEALEYTNFAPPAVQERYVETFDLNPKCALDVGWHLYGEAPERGVFLSMLRDDLARAGVDEHGDLPDHLPTLLRLIPREDDKSASELAALIAPAVTRLREVLAADGNPFADVVDTVAHLLDARITTDTGAITTDTWGQTPRTPRSGRD